MGLAVETAAGSPADPPEETRAEPERDSGAAAHHVHHEHTFLQAFQSLVNIIVVALFIITFTVQPFRIPSESMEPTLQVGDFLLVDKQVGLEGPPRIFAPEGQIRRGDLVVFHYSVDPTLHLVKRVVGLPGDHLRLHDGRVFLNDRPLAEPYAVFRPSVPDIYRDEFPRMSSADPGVDSRWWLQMERLVRNGELTIPADSFFVLGDNRNDSEDSRYWGFVPRDAIVGKPFLIYFSLNTAAPGQMQADGKSSGDEAATATHFARWDRALRIIR